LGNYYLYRIDTGYDGFLPSLIPERSERGILRFNWRSYVESLEPDDIVLTYFKGTGCRAGIYAVAAVRQIDVSGREKNVAARLLRFSDRDRAPLIPVRGNEDLFGRIRTRPRGSEVVVPETCEGELLAILQSDEILVAEAARRNIMLPGQVPYGFTAVSQVPLVNLNGDLSTAVQSAGIIAAFWIKPRQASWITRPPRWLPFVTRVFSGFKAGDPSRLDELAQTLAQQVRSVLSGDIGVVVGVPLNESKRRAGEADRVAELGQRLAAELGVRFSQAFRLDGDVSRRLYKNRGKTTSEFQADYRDALSVIRTTAVADCVRSGRTILLVDDVYTDGVTTALVARALNEVLPNEDLRIRISTLAINAKMGNMDEDLVRCWS